MDEFAGVVVGAIIIGIVLATGHWMYGRLSESISARLHWRWRWLALPITGVLCGGAFAALRPLVVDQPRTPLWFVLGAAAVALLSASATALGWTLVNLGRGLVALSWAEPAPPNDQERSADPDHD